MNPRICLYCGAAFIGAITARYCSQSCDSAAARARAERKSDTPYTVTGTATCAYCGQPMTPKHPTKRYCSDACKMRQYRMRRVKS